MTATAAPHVYTAIAAVMGALSKDGITKDRKASGGGASYNFRGVDDVYNTLSSILAANKLCIIPRVLSRECVERTSKSGGALFYTAVDVEFDIVSALDGSRHTARTQGEAMDSSDKSTNKAMSAAYKYMAFQTFCIPTEGDNDADATGHDEIESAFVTASCNAIRKLKTEAACAAWWKANVEALKGSHPNDRDAVLICLKKHKEGLKAAPAPFDDPIPFGDDQKEAA